MIAPLFADHTHVSLAVGATLAVKVLVEPLHTGVLGTSGQEPIPRTFTEQLDESLQPVVLLVTTTLKLTVPPASNTPAVYTGFFIVKLLNEPAPFSVHE